VPVYPLRFTRWEAPRLSSRWAWWHLARTSLRVRAGSLLMRRVRLFWALYLVVFVVATYLVERRSEFAFMQNLLGADPEGPLAVVLHTPTRLFAFLSSPIEVITLVIVSLYAGAGLIADDRRTGALALYLSKPVTKIQYLASRLTVMAVYIAYFSVLPALGLLLFGIAISDTPGAALGDLMMVPGLLGCWVVLTALFGLPVLVISSFTERGRTAGVVFVILWFLGRFAGGVLDLALGAKIGTLVDLKRMVAGTTAALLGARGEGLVRNVVEEMMQVAPPVWIFTTLFIYCAAGLAVLWWRTRTGEENR